MFLSGSKRSQGLNCTNKVQTMDNARASSVWVFPARGLPHEIWVMIRNRNGCDLGVSFVVIDVILETPMTLRIEDINADTQRGTMGSAGALLFEVKI